MITQDGKTVIKIALGVCLVLLVLGYIYYQSRNLINGPQITIAEPLNGSTVADPLVAIQGIAKNISYITLNDRQIYVDKDGAFKEELLLSPGYNLWKIEAKDKFGRVVSKRIELVLNKT
jgi:hypothetical protein